MLKHWKSKTVASLLLILGVPIIIFSIFIIIVISVMIESHGDLLPLGYLGSVLVLVPCSGAIACGILLTVAGVYALRRRRWRLVLAGSIAEILAFPPVGAAASLMTILANDEFAVKSKLSTTKKRFFKIFFISLEAGLIPIVVLTTIAMTQMESWGYTDLGQLIASIQAVYAILLIPIMIIFFILRKKEIALGVLASFVVGFPAAIFIGLAGA